MALVKKFNGVLIEGTKAVQAAELMFLIIAIVVSLHYEENYCVFSEYHKCVLLPLT